MLPGTREIVIRMGHTIMYSEIHIHNHKHFKYLVTFLNKVSDIQSSARAKHVNIYFSTTQNSRSR